MAPDKMQSLRERAEAMIRSAVEAWGNGDQGAAISANEAALDVCRELVRASADPTDSDVTLLLASLRNSGTIQHDLGHGEAALRLAQEAVAFCRERADVFNLASCLNSLAVSNRALGRLSDAITATEEAISLIWPQFDANPSEHADTMDLLLRNLGLWHQEAGRPVPSELVERFHTFRSKVESQNRSQRTGLVSSEHREVDMAARFLSEVYKTVLTAKALNHDDKVVAWACQLMYLLLSLTWRIRGWHVSVPSQDDATARPQFFIGLPPDSPEAIPMRAVDLARVVMAGYSSGSQPRAGALDELAEALRSAPGDDQLVRVAQAVQNAGRAGALTLKLVNDIVEALLTALRSTAIELEASRPKMPDPGYVGDLPSMPVASIVTPTPGEAMRVLDHVIEVTEQHFGTKIVAVVASPL